MYNDTREPNFNQHPYIEANQFDCFSSYDEIGYEIKQKLNQMEQQKKIIVIDCYHGVNQSALLDNLITDLQPDEIIHTEDALLTQQSCSQNLKNSLFRRIVRMEHLLSVLQKNIFQKKNWRI